MEYDALRSEAAAFLRLRVGKKECGRLELLIGVLAPVRKCAAVCFEWVAANSVCEPEPVRNAEH
jgi:hypothetical protein